MMASAKDQAGVKLGENMINGGLGIQILFFGFFIIVTSIFHYRIRACPTTRTRSLTIPWERYLFVLYAVSFLILVRSVFRIIEYVMGSDGILLGNEVFLYVFDATLMLGAMVLFNLWHPGKIITKESLGGLMRAESGDSGYVLENQGARFGQKP